MAYGQTPCEALATATNTKIKDVDLPDNFNSKLNNQDRFYVCSKTPANPGNDRVLHSLLGLRLPTALKHAEMSFHHMCGHDGAVGTLATVNCSIGVAWDDKDAFFEVDPTKHYDEGDVSTATEFNFEQLRIPGLKSGSRLRLNAMFDLTDGMLGLNNVKVTTRQRCVNPTWSKFGGGYKFR